jgi:hypothetical protein
MFTILLFFHIDFIRLNDNLCFSNSMYGRTLSISWKYVLFFHNNIFVVLMFYHAGVVRVNENVYSPKTTKFWKLPLINEESCRFNENTKVFFRKICSQNYLYNHISTIRVNEFYNFKTKQLNYGFFE